MNLRNLNLSILSGLGVTLITSLQAIILAPVLISSVGVSMYGAWVMVADVFIALQIFDLGITAYSAQRIALARAAKQDKSANANFFATVTLIGVAVILLSILSAMAISRIPLPGELSGVEKSVIRDCIVIGVSSVAVQLLGYTLIAPLRALERMDGVNASSIIGALVGFLLTVVLLYLDFGLFAAAYGMLARTVCGLVGGVYSMFALRDVFNINTVDAEDYRAALLDQIKNAPVTFLGNLSAIILASSDSLLVGQFAGLSSVAMYSVSRKIFDFARAVIDLFAYSSYGGFAAAYARKLPDERNVYFQGYVVSALYSCMLLISCSYAIADVFVTVWVGVEHYVGAPIVTLIAVAALLSSLSNFLFSGLRATGMFRVATLAIVVELVIKLSFAAVLISAFGLGGMPLAIMLSAMGSISIALWRFDPISVFKRFKDGSVVTYGTSISLVLAICSYLMPGTTISYVAKFSAILASLAALRAAYAKLALPASLSRRRK